MDRPPEEMTVAGIATELVDAVRSAEPQGPYALAGICSGGPIVLEMARQLVDSGSEVELVVLVDPRVTTPSGLRQTAWRVALHLRHGSFLTAARRKLRRGSPAEVAVHEHEFYRRLSAARDAYIVRPLPGVPAAFIETKDYGLRLAIPSWVWRDALPDGFESRRLPYEHEALMFAPAIDAFAAALADLVAEAGG
jgi:hypothetical protein